MNLNLSNFTSKEKPDWLKIYLITLIFLGFAGFSTLRGWINVCFVLLIIPALFAVPRTFKFFSVSRQSLLLKLLLAGLTIPVLALFVSQLWRNDWLMNAYDGPSRILLTIPLIFYVFYKGINFSIILGCATPVALLATFISIQLHPEIIEQWGGRYATTFVDPNAFGLYSVALTAFCLFQMDLRLNPTKAWIGLQLIGLFSGLYLIVGSGTRGSWLALPIISIIWILMNYKRLSLKSLGAIAIAVTVTMIFMGYIFPHTAQRALSGFSELRNWMNHTELDTSTGIRLSMWKMSWDLFLHSPIVGYGDLGFSKYLGQPWVNTDTTKIAIDTITCCGPHNEWLANILRSGLFGLLSVIGLLLVPMAFFAMQLGAESNNTKLAAELGLAYIITLLICSISMEVFNLKYSCSFYGLMMAGLIGQIMNSNLQFQRK